MVGAAIWPGVAGLAAVFRFFVLDPDCGDKKKDDFSQKKQWFSAIFAHQTYRRNVFITKIVFDLKIVS